MKCTKLQSELRAARKFGVTHFNTCNAPNWDRELHDATLLLQVHPPDDIQVRHNKVHGVDEWTLIDLKPDTRPLQLNSVGCAIDAKTGIVYPLFNDGTIDDKSPWELEEMTGEWYKGLTSEDKQTIEKVKESIFRDAERPETADEAMRIIRKKANEEAKKDQFEVFGAYQHFLYNFDQNHFQAYSPFDHHMTSHFISKLNGFRQSIQYREGYNSVPVLATWIQEMSTNNQAIMLDYILKYHSNKG